jgi:hypothetical protein
MLCSTCALKPPESTDKSLQIRRTTEHCSRCSEDIDCVFRVVTQCILIGAYQNDEGTYSLRGVGVDQSVQCLTTDWMTVFRSPAEAKVFSLVSVSRLALGLSQPPVQWVPGSFPRK